MEIDGEQLRPKVRTALDVKFTYLTSNYQILISRVVDQQESMLPLTMWDPLAIVETFDR